MIQKHTNKSYSNLERRVDDLSQIDRYKQLKDGEGLTHEAAKQRIKFEDDINWLKMQRGETVGSELTEAPAPERASSINYDNAYKKVGIEPPSSQEELDWALRFQSQDDLENELWKRARLIAQSTKPASPGTAIQPGGGKSPAPIEEGDLIEELVKLQKSDTDIARQDEIEKLLKEMGAWA
jgi:hypothetical protein